jgi:hypothetical protein
MENDVVLLEFSSLKPPDVEGRYRVDTLDWWPQELGGRQFGPFHELGGRRSGKNPFADPEPDVRAVYIPSVDIGFWARFKPSMMRSCSLGSVPVLLAASSPSRMG